MVSANNIFRPEVFLSRIYKLLKKKVYFEVCKTGRKFIFCEYIRIDYRDRLVVCKFEGRGIFFKRDTQPRGISAKVPVPMIVLPFYAVGCSVC